MIWARQRGRFEELSLEGVKCKSINFTGAPALLLKAGLGKGVALKSFPWKVSNGKVSTLLGPAPYF